jgi:Holliday junction DNA helicase RuvB
LIGATTRFGLLTSPLRARFGIVEQLSLYSDEELVAIVKRGSAAMSIKISEEAGAEIAKRSRGTPRIALRLLRRVRDVADVRGIASIDANTAAKAMDMLEIDPFGLDEGDRRILRSIIELFEGGPVGLSTIAAALNEDPQTIEDIYEPYLIQKGFLERTPRGRRATVGAYNYLGKPLPSEARDNILKQNFQSKLPYQNEE